MRDVHLTANARPLGSTQAAGTGPLALSVWAAGQSGGNATVLNPPGLRATNGVVDVGAPDYWTNLYIGQAIGGDGAEVRPRNTAYHPRIHA